MHPKRLFALLLCLSLILSFTLACTNSSKQSLEEQGTSEKDTQEVAKEPTKTIKKSKAKKEEKKSKAREFEIVEKKDLSLKALDAPYASYSWEEIEELPMNKRFGYGIVVPTDIKSDEVKATIEQLIKGETKANRDIDQIIVDVYDRKEDVGKEYTVAQAVWGPLGEWGPVSSKIAASNDRSNYKIDYDIREKTSSPTDRPTEREFEIYDAFDEVLWSKPDTPELQLAAEVAKEFAITSDEVIAIYEKVDSWKRN